MFKATLNQNHCNNDAHITIKNNQSSNHDFYKGGLPFITLKIIAIKAITNKICIIPPVAYPPKKLIAHIITNITATV
jgi:hypothetical protein